MIKSLPLLQKGKVRDIYEVDDARLLIVASDRLSAFDVVFDEPIIGKGKVLNTVSNFWFAKTQHIIPNHLTHQHLSEVLPVAEADFLQDRAVIVKRLKPLPVEAIIRGYLLGSGFRDYQQNGTISGIKLTPNLQLAEKLPEPLYTPSDKAPSGEHDENISLAKTIDILGEKVALEVQNAALEIYQFAAKFALKKGIIIADTKFEFGLDFDGKLTLMDEVLTPDSSRFWSVADYKIGTSPASFDKQIIRDYLAGTSWDKTPPPPKLPMSIIQKTSEKYQQLQNLLCN